MKNKFAQKKTANINLRRFLSVFVVLGLIAIVVFLPPRFRSEAGNLDFSQTKIHDNKPENYDIRADKTQKETLMSFRNLSGKRAVEIADARDKFIAGEAALRRKVPTLKIEYNDDIETPEIIAPDAKLGRAFLSAASTGERTEILRNFAKENNDLLGLSENEVDELKLAADYINPDGNLSFASFKQEINGVPVFRGEIKAGFTKNGEIIRVVNNLAPDLDYKNLSSDFGNPLDAVNRAASYINYQLKINDLLQNDSASNDLKTVFGKGDWATTAEKIYFPVEPGVARAAWRVLIWEKINAYYVIVDAETGAMLWRKNIAEDQSEPATFSVYTNPSSMINVAQSPFPFSSGGLLNPTLGTQGAATNRTNITLVGNEAPFAFNNNGWISDGGNRTDGNAVEAGIDRDGTDGIDAQGSAAGNPNRNFVFAYSPGNPNTNTGDVPNPSPQTYPITTYQNGVVTQLFYIANRFHDEMYRLGFNEQAGNFQADNFGRGGKANDRISAEAQDSSGVNNASFAAPADGSRGRMQMFLWNAPQPSFDGDLDASIVVHELTHGLSNRLHGNSEGLSSYMSLGMGEGWSDFYALSLLSSPNDPIGGVYPLGAYVTYLGRPNFTANNYYGIRRFPKAIMTSVGPNGKPHNPLTFRHLNADCNTEIGTTTQIGTISAYPRGAFGSTTCDETHAAGEIWSNALWEVRARFVNRLGWEIGNRKTLQIVTDAMKIAPLNPTFLQERDAIIATAQASGATTAEAEADVADVWEGFRIRGMGFSAKINSVSPTNVTEAFDSPNLLQTPDFTVSDSSGNNNGFAEPNETVSLSIPLTNSAGKTAFGTTVQIVGSGSLGNYGDIPNNQTVTKTINFTVPANQSCGSVLPLTLNINSSLGAKTENRLLVIGKPIIGNTENFDAVSAPNLPSEWRSTQTVFGENWMTETDVADTNPNSAFVPNVGKYGSADLESPSYNVESSAAVLKFRNNFDTERGWDGGVLEISIGGAPFQDILAAGGAFLENGYTGALGDNQNPLGTRQAWTGNSGGYVTTRVLLPAAAQGKTVKFKWRFGEDLNTAVVGWNIDSVELVSNYSCSAVPTPKSRKRVRFF